MQQQGPQLHGGVPHGPARAPIFTAPAVVSRLALVIVASHVIFIVLPAAAQDWLAWRGAVSPQRFLSGQGGPLSMAAPLVSHMFLHGGWLHLMFNSIWLMAFGAPVARRMGAEHGAGAVGASLLFVVFFALSGVFGALTYIALHPNDTTLLIGASGGVSGLLGGLVRFAFRRFPATPGDFSGLFDRPVIAWTVTVVSLNVAMAFVGAGLTGGADIAWEAHIGGYFFGLLTFPLFARRRRAI